MTDDDEVDDADHPIGEVDTDDEFELNKVDREEDDGNDDDT